MSHCKECGANEQGSKIIVNNFESYEVCNACGAEDSIIEINEDDYREDLETDRRISEFKDRK